MMKGIVTVLVSCAAVCVSACAAESGSGEGEAVEAVASELTLFSPAPPRPVPPRLPTTLEQWRARCGSSKYPYGVIVPRASWSCPSVPAGPGSYVGLDGRQWVADARTEGLTEEGLMNLSPDLTPEMAYGLQPFCVYGYQYTPTSNVAGDRAPEINRAANHFSTLESAVGPAAGPLCIPLDFPHPGSTGCPTCWRPVLVFDLPLVIPY